jgi:hypothetical protein
MGRPLLNATLANRLVVRRDHPPHTFRITRVSRTGAQRFISPTSPTSVFSLVDQGVADGEIDLHTPPFFDATPPTPVHTPPTLSIIATKGAQIPCPCCISNTACRTQPLSERQAACLPHATKPPSEEDRCPRLLDAACPARSSDHQTRCPALCPR